MNDNRDHNEDEVYEVQAEIVDESAEDEPGLVTYPGWQENSNESMYGNQQFQIYSRGCGCPGCSCSGCLLFLVFIISLLILLFK